MPDVAAGRPPRQDAPQTDGFGTERSLAVLIEQLRNEVAERTLAEQSLRVAKAAAERANESNSQLLAAASHELSQPLHSRSPLNELLADEPAGPASERVIEGRR